jgi:hypothetical protein
VEKFRKARRFSISFRHSCKVKKGGAGVGFSALVYDPGDPAENTRPYIALVKRMRMIRTPQIRATCSAPTCGVRVIRVLYIALNQARHQVRF